MKMQQKKANKSLSESMGIARILRFYRLYFFICCGGGFTS